VDLIAGFAPVKSADHGGRADADVGSLSRLARAAQPAVGAAVLFLWSWPSAAPLAPDHAALERLDAREIAKGS
jgi:hypothetical protein